MTSHQWLLFWAVGQLVVCGAAGVVVLPRLVVQLLQERLGRDARQYQLTSERSALTERLRFEIGYDPSLRRGQK